MMTFQSLQMIYLQFQSHCLYLILCLDEHLSHMTPEQTYQTLPQHLPNDALDVVVEKKTSFSGKIKKVDQESEVCQDILHLLTDAFRYSHLRMQAQVLQHYHPSSVWLAARNMKQPHFCSNFKKSENQIIFNVEGFTVCHLYHLHIKKCLSMSFLNHICFPFKFLIKSINICICIFLCF